MLTEFKSVQFSDNAFQDVNFCTDKSIIGSVQSIYGMIGKFRKLGGVAFASLHTYRDRIQCVFEGEGISLTDSIRVGDFVQITGKIVQNEKAQNGLEMIVSDVVKLAGPKKSETFAFDKPLKERIDTLLDNRLVTLRNFRERAIFKLQEGVARAFREFFTERGFTEIRSPKLTKGGAEGGANIFSLDYFGQKAFLAQSPQFYKQFMVPVFGRVFEIGPVFRAEEHATSRHINEYTGLDIEMGYIESFRDIMKMELGFLQFLMNFLAKNYSREIEILDVQLPHLSSGITEISFVEAKEMLAIENTVSSKADNDLSPEEEREICRIIQEKTGSEFVFVTHYPESKRPFYTKPSKHMPGYTESFDLLFRGIEITSGGQRINEYEEQIEGFQKKGLNPDDFSTFLELHSNGTPPHGGFGIGMERLLLKLINGENIRETVLFPRDINRLTP